MSGLRVDRAAPEELPILAALYDEAARWLLARGIAQWQVGEYTPQHLVSLEAFVARDGETPVGGFCFVPPDPMLWPDAAQREATYVAGLVVARSHAGQGAWLLAEAEKLAATPRLRLDCWEGNEKLKAFYTRAGFTECGTMAEQTWRVQRFEKIRGA